MRVLFCLLLIAAACATLVSSQHQCPNGFSLGTAAGLSDVVSNCDPQAGWNQINNHQEKPLNTSLDFVATVAATVTSAYEIFFSYRDLNVVEVAMDALEQAGTLIGGVQKPLHMKFKCEDDNGITYTLVTVTFRFTTPSPFDVSFYFWKYCQLPPLYIGSYGPAGMEPNVAIGGHVVPSFQHVSTPDILSEDFFIWIPNVIGGFENYPYWNFSQPNPVAISWLNKQLLPSIDYTLSSPTVFPAVNNTYTKLTISYSCNNALPAGSDTVSVAIDVGFVQWLKWSYTKNCSYGNGIGNATIFNAQLKRTRELAIAGGSVQDDWGRAQGHHIPQNEHEVDFVVWITDQTREQGNELPFNVTCTVTNGANNIMINDGSTAPRSFAAKMKNAPGVNVTVPMDLTCLHSGEGTGTVLFDFGQQYNPLTIHFQYLCSTPYFDIDYMNQDGTIVIKRILSANVPQSWDYTSPANSTKEVFRVGLNPQTSYMVQDITFDNVAYDATVMKRPIVLPTTQWIPVNQTTPVLAQILFDCLPSQSSTTTPIVIRMDYGWNVYQNISFWKTCAAVPTPAPGTSSSSSSGWSAAGIFFFTVFILTLVGCLTGAGYKYAKEDKRGWDVIPGITYYRSCYESACPTKRYTPQTDYYADNVPDHGGKSYQTDL